MANETVYPFGPGGQIPSGISIVNDLTTGGADKALSAEMGKEIGESISEINTILSETHTISYSSAEKVVYKKDGTTVALSSSSQGRTLIYNIPSPGKKFKAQLTGIGSSSTYANCVAVIYWDNSNIVVGWEYAQGTISGDVKVPLTIPSGATKVGTYVNPYNAGYIEYSVDIDPISEDETLRLINGTKIPLTLQGKNVAVCGDSISCFGTEAQVRAGNYITPFWKVLSVDVGQSIQSWVTWLDVYTSVDGTTPTGKTIGGVTLTSAMIGTLQTFTPVAEDVGKCIGVPRWASAYTTKPWWQVFAEQTGVTICANASWSGSQVVPIPASSSRHASFVLSEMYSEYTLGRMKGRDENGNDIIPDIVILYRGTNDFISDDASDPTSNESIETPDMKSFTGITDTRNMTQCYIWTILKVREKYPKATIILCTFNVFKRINYSHFPTNNGTYTLPDYNNKIREIANLMGCGVIEFDKDGITFENCYPTYISDSSTTPLHPNTTGHLVMGEKAVSDVVYILNH